MSQKLDKFSDSVFLICLVSFLCGAATLLPGCSSPTKTAYTAETAGYVTLKAAADGYKQLVASGVKLTPAQIAQAHQLFAAAQEADLTAIDATAALAASTNGVAGVIDPVTANNNASNALTDLVTFLKTIGVKL